MGKRNGKAKPSDPQAILQARSDARRAERVASKDPSTWGVDPDQLSLSANDDVVRLLSGERHEVGRQVREARRLDAFDQLLKNNGLTVAQHQAAGRLMADVAEQMGIQTADRWRPLDPKMDGGDASELVTQRMIDAGRRVNQVLRLVGLADAQLLKELVRVTVFEQAGVTTFWRGTVQKITGETERHCQGSVVRRACENLRLAYEEVNSQR